MFSGVLPIIGNTGRLAKSYIANSKNDQLQMKKKTNQKSNQKINYLIRNDVFFSTN